MDKMNSILYIVLIVYTTLPPAVYVYTDPEMANALYDLSCADRMYLLRKDPFCTQTTVIKSRSI